MRAEMIAELERLEKMSMTVEERVVEGKKILASFNALVEQVWCDDR